MFWLPALRICELLTLVSPVPDGNVIVIALLASVDTPPVDDVSKLIE